MSYYNEKLFNEVISGKKPKVRKDKRDRHTLQPAARTMNLKNASMTDSSGNYIKKHLTK